MSELAKTWSGGTEGQYLREIAAIAAFDHDLFNEQPVSLISLKGEILTWNGACERLFGLSSDQAVGQTLSFLYPSAEKNEGSWREDLKIAERLGRFEKEEWRIKGTGGKFWALVHWLSLRSETGELLGYAQRIKVSERQTKNSVDLKLAVSDPLAEIRNRLDLAVKTARLGVWDCDLATGQVVCNEHHSRVLGYPLEKRTGTREEFAERVHPEDQARVLSGTQRALQNGTDYETEFRVILPDGKIHWLLGRGRGVYDSAGKPIRLNGILLDITARKLAELERKKALSALEETEHRFEAIANASPALFWTSSPDYFNQAWLSFRGRALEEEQCDGWIEGVHPDDRQAAKQQYSKAVESRQEFKIEYRLKRHDGEYRWILDHGLPRFNSNQEFVGFLGICIDIHDRKTAEENLKRHETWLRQSEARYRSLVAATTAVVWVSGPDCKFVAAQPSWENYTGQQWPEYAGLGWLEALYAEDRLAVRERLQNAVEKGSAFSFEARVFHAESNTFRILFGRAVPIQENGQQIREWVGTFQDVQEQKEAEMNLKRHVQELRLSNAELAQFAYVSSHDLKEPLRMISLYLQLLRKKHQEQLDEEARSCIQYAVDGAKRLDALISDLLVYSSLRRQPQKLAEVDAAEVIETVVQELKEEFKDGSFQVEMKRLPKVIAVRSQVQLLFQHLIENSLKFRSERPLRVVIECENRTNEWAFAVRDNGMGIPEDYWDRVFIIFQRLHPRGKFEGTGVGLAICKKIIDLYGGKIWIEEGAQGGTTVLFTFPKKPYLGL